MVFLFCLFVFSLSKKPTSLIIQTGCSLIADEVKDAACGWRNTLSDYSIASQSAFAWVYILQNACVSVPYSACFIIIINIPFCHLSCLWFKVVESFQHVLETKEEVKKAELSLCRSSPPVRTQVYFI